MTDHTNIDIDKTQIDNLKEAFDGDIKPFIQKYFEDFEVKNRDLESSIKEKRAKDVISIAHTLKGNSANVGARGLAKKCEEIEQAGKANDFSNMLQTYEELNKLYPLFKTAFLDSKFTS